MTIEKIKIPDLGEAVDVEVIEICVQPGDTVSKDDSIIVLESEKAAMEIPASVAGKIVDIKVSNGDTVSEGTIFLEIEAETETETVTPDKETPRREILKDTEDNISDATPSSEAPEPERPETIITYSGNLYAGPAVRKLAREFGIDLNKVTPSGPRGRMVKEDLHSFVKNRLNSSTPEIVKNPNVDFSKWGDIQLEPLTKFQKTSAQNLQQSWRNIPHVTQHDEANIDSLMELRAQLNKDSGLKISPLAFFVKAIAKLLEEFPLMNASLDENTENIVLKDYINIGIAIDTPKGLIVPNIKNTNNLSITEISNDINRMAKAAKERKIKVDELKGSTFTISSLGAIGGKFFTPIINPPEVGILGISKSFDAISLNNGELQTFTMLPISLSYDHRLINGVEAVKFTTRFCQILMNLDFFKTNY